MTTNNNYDIMDSQEFVDLYRERLDIYSAARWNSDGSEQPFREWHQPLKVLKEMQGYLAFHYGMKRLEGERG